MSNETPEITQEPGQNQAPVDPSQTTPGAAQSLDEVVAALQAELAASKDQTLRALAEAENIRKRTERQVAEARVYAVDRFARDLLPVADNLARAVAALSPDAREALVGEARSLLEGVELTQKALISGFERHGLKPIEDADVAFDPNIHEAVAQIPAPQPAGRVAQIFQPGWRLADRTLRPAMVAVSQGPAASASPVQDAGKAAQTGPATAPGSIIDQQA